MKKWKCGPCGYIYDPQEGDPENGVSAGTPFEQLPEEWICPICGFKKNRFYQLDE